MHQSYYSGKIFGDKKIKITVGKNDTGVVPALTSFGAVHVEGTADNIVVDNNNKIVSTPAFMLGTSASNIAPGIKKLTEKIIQIVKK